MLLYDSTTANLLDAKTIEFNTSDVERTSPQGGNLVPGTRSDEGDTFKMVIDETIDRMCSQLCTSWSVQCNLCFSLYKLNRIKYNY